MADDQDKSEKARELAEQGIEAGEAGDVRKAEKLVKEARKLDSEVVAEVAEEIERDREEATSFQEKSGE